MAASATSPVHTQRIRAEIPEDGWLRVLKPGSRVARRDSKNLLTDIEIIEPLLMSIIEDKPAKLHYRYHPAHAPLGRAVTLFTPETAIERVGDEWSETLWNPTTREFRDDEEPPISVMAPQAADTSPADCRS